MNAPISMPSNNMQPVLEEKYQQGQQERQQALDKAYQEFLQRKQQERKKATQAFDEKPGEKVNAKGPEARKDEYVDLSTIKSKKKESAFDKLERIKK